MLMAHKHPKRRAAWLRNPERTRERLLQAAFREVYRSEFQSASLNTILAAAGVSKGALYFDRKEALGYALVEEVIAPDLRGNWLRPLESGQDPMDTLIGIVQGESVRPEDVRSGCRLNNLAQEVSPLDEGFRERLATVFHEWQQGIASALRKRQTHGTVRPEVERAETAGFLMAMVEGYVSLAKNAQGVKVAKTGKKNTVAGCGPGAPGNRKRG